MTGLVEELAASVDPVVLLRRIAEQTCVLVPGADGAAVTMIDGSDGFVVVSAHGALAPQLGRRVPIDDTFLAVALRSGRPEMCEDLLSDPRLTPSVRAVGLTLGVHSSLSIPLFHGGRAIGVLSVVAHRSYAFGEDGIANIASTSTLISAMISAHSELARLVRDLIEDGTHPAAGPRMRFLASLVDPELAERNRRSEAVDGLVASGVGAVFQPVVALDDLSVCGYEGLARFCDQHLHGPDHWFAEARRARRGVDLQLAALRAVLAAAESIPPDRLVGVNLSPSVVLDPAIQEVLQAVDRPLVVELTEHEPVPERLATGLEPLRERGLLVAVDDAGAGFANLTRILRLRPDMLKLDRQLTAGVDTDPVRRSLVSALVHFAGELGAATVGEGIETEEQYRTLRDLGLGYGQGYWLGRPSPVEDLPPSG